MHIELTDHLRCPVEHDEAFLVLLPDQMAGRRVVVGQLGCPICGWSIDWTDETPKFGPAPRPSSGTVPFSASQALTLLGLEGPGGWLALAGRSAGLANEIAGLLPGVLIVAVNPPETVEPDEQVSVIEASLWPIKRHSLRGALLGADSGLDALQVIASVLPGLRAVGEGESPSLNDGQDLLAESAGVWVVKAG